MLCLSLPCILDHTCRHLGNSCWAECYFTLDLLLILFMLLLRYLIEERLSELIHQVEVFLYPLNISLMDIESLVLF